MNPVTNHQPVTRQTIPVSCPFDYMRNLSPEASLLCAVARNDFDGVSYVLDYSDVDFSGLDYWGQNIIHSAIDLGRDDEIVYLLIERSQSSNAIHEVDRNGYTPLMLAVEHGKIQLAVCLITDRQATFSEGNDATCHPDRLSRKQQTLVHTRLLVESGGDIAGAHRLALGRGIDSFEKSFIVQHNALKHACRTGDIKAAKAIIAAGVDASFVLMRTLSGHGLTVSPERAAITKNLLAAGAHPTVALKHALSKTAIDHRTVQALLMLGASDAVLESFIRERATSFDKIFLKNINKKNWSSTLTNAALQGDKAAVKFWVKSGAVHPDPTLIFLATDRRTDAIKLLLNEGADANSVLLQLLSDGNTEAVRSLISAGADISKLLRTMLVTQRFGLRIGIEKLQTLIKAGADLSQLLLASTNKQERLYIAKILLAAGANTEAAVALCPESTRLEVTKTLALAAQEADAAKKTMRDTGSSDITLVENILLAKEFTARADRSEPREIHTKMVDVFQADGRQADADLLRAVMRVNWSEIKAGVAGNRVAGSVVLNIMLQTGDIPSARLLLQAGADMISAIVVANKGMEDDDKFNPHIAKLLLAADHRAHLVLEYLVDSNMELSAKEAIKLSKFNVVDMFSHLRKTRNVAAIAKLNPLHTIEPAHTGTQSSQNLALSLLSAGLNKSRTFFEALDAGDPGTAGVLAEFLDDKSAALAKALSSARTSIAETLLVLGADLSLALREVDPGRMGLVKTLLPAGAGSLSPQV